MAMEMHVLADRQLASIAEWQRAIDREGYPLSLAEDVELAKVKGLIPAALNGRDTGFECYRDNAKETLEWLGLDHFDHGWQYALGFRWRGDMSELLAAWMAATAYAAATQGILFDHQEAKAFTPEQARETVRAIERDIPRMEAALAELIKKFAQRSEQ